MVLIFFYNHFTDIELIKKININYEMNDGYIIIQSYDTEKKVLKISDKIENNNTKLHGKILNFNMNLDDILKKIKEMDILKLEKKYYTLDTVYVKQEFGSVCKAYIIY
jgi:hypothetical protein